MRFQVLDIIPHLKNPVTGEIVSTADRLNQVVETARRAEELGYDSFSVGERHAGEFISSSPTTVLAAIAAVTSRIRLQSGVTVLSVLDPVRVAEDYATIDQLSRGRLELVIGKGNEVLQYPLFGLDLADQWELLAEKYGLLRRLWTEENVTWSGRFRPALTEPTTTTPRPFAGAPRVWHGSATSLTSAALAAQWGDPLFTANAIQPRENYKVLIDHYREEYERHGHDPRHQYLGSGSGAGGVFIADTTQEAKRQFGPVYEALTTGRNVPGNNSPYRDIDHAVAEGPALVGSPEQVIDKILSYHSLYGHDLQSISLPTTLPFGQQLEILERFALEVIPAVRAAAPTTLWGSGDPYAGVPSPAPPAQQVPNPMPRPASQPTTTSTGARMSTPTDTSAHAETAGRSRDVGTTDAGNTPDRAFEAAWADWHAAHERHRADPHGFLAVTHLHWLDAAPGRLDGAPGTWSIEDDVVRLVLGAGERVLRNGQELNPDATGATVFLGPISEREGLNLRVEDAGAGHTVIELAKRGGRYVVRPRHPLNPLLTGYRGTPAYVPDPKYSIQGIFVPFAEPRPTTVGAAVEGIHHVYEAPGEIRFRLHGEDLSLTAFNGHAPGTLSVLFTDATSGKSTYAANRSLTVPAPGPDGTVSLDFNRAVNLPCAYTDLATCPLPPAENRLPVAIEAGEQIPYERQDAS